MYVKVPLNTITKISIVETDCKMTLANVVNTYKPDYVINGGLYDMHTGKVNPIPLRINGATIATCPDGYWAFGWNIGPDIKMIHSSEMSKYKNVVACSAMLKDGNNTIFKYTSAQGGVRGRTGIGTDKSNLHLFVTTDTNGALLPTSLRTKMKSSGCLDGIMLDCGGSSQMYANGKYYQAEKRRVAYWICVWVSHPNTVNPPASTVKCPYKEPTVNVKRGSTGNNASWVQWYLWKLGYLASEKDVDGIFGNGSTNALINFQKKVFTSKRDIDGICGSGTRAKLKSSLK